MDGAIAGRDSVVAQVWQALSEPVPVLVDGPPGIGKTAVWRALVADAVRAGWLVLACAPTESETALPFVALADLLRPLTGRISELPRPQRLAAEVALLDSDAAEVVDDRAIGAAVRALLDAAVADTTYPRVLVAVDDAPWLDPASERALRFALRRVVPQIATLVICRTTGGEPPAVPLGLDQAPAGGRLARINLSPLGVGALHHVLRARLGTTLSRPLLARIAQHSGGNPLLAIELGRAMLRLPKLPSPGEDLPVASSMQQLLADALAALPTASRDAVRLAALLAVPSVRDLGAAGVDLAAFDSAEEAGLLVVTPTVVEFTHPVYPAAVRAGIPPGIRRRLHRGLADVVTDPDERARHLARCTMEPEAGVARELAEAAGRQRTRGAPELAAELYERAAELTPTEAAGDRGWRRLAAVRCRFDSGDYLAAGTAAEAVASDTTGDLRAEALLLRAAVAWCTDDARTAVSAARRGLASAREGTALAGRIHAHLSLFWDVPEPARRHAEVAVALLSDRDDHRALLADALLLLLFNEVRAGRPARTSLLDRALELEGEEPSWLAGTVPAIWWKGIDEHTRARDRLHRMLAGATVRGDEPSQHELLLHLGETELLAGRWDAAGRHISAAHELGEQLGTGLIGEMWLAGLLDAHRGRLVEAASVAEAGLRRADRLGDAWCRRIHQQLAGFVALSAGRTADAARIYGDLAATMDTLGLVEALTQRFEPDWVEACIAAGALDTAGAVLDRLAERHARLPRPWTMLGLARSRVLLASATGADPTEALDDLATARAGVPADVLPLDRARCLLVAGMAHRRARRRRQARQVLDDAIAEFAALGAAAFENRARSELARLGGRPSAPLELTATEARVARLAAQGRTNRVIADTLFVSPKTVEANLARIYRKLGISSRAELGAAMANLPEDDG
ncbi:helix-turn-helix transcriptional regulator [Micromonospora polyrhachis]|uniref:DNA-binding CsgD family transcriptional regulator n=1 Tax=Micromonospora polyrhachis TaxID=1282883 RepID=A0A7W7WN32_9ACTN|nr:LuxR family transcriptional regulator [Micromonospora polyrhachis]MBB4956808.1 DNA-binding CsgD family transcriptional regulator [Micromonospora polyrhachis]